MVALAVAELVGEAIVPIHMLNPDLVLPIGSNFKLWILGALAMQVASGVALPKNIALAFIPSQPS